MSILIYIEFRLDIDELCFSKYIDYILGIRQ